MAVIEVWEWGPQVGWQLLAHHRRHFRHLAKPDRHLGFAKRLGGGKLADYAGPGHWNDADMMIVGMVSVGSGRNFHPTRLTPDEQYTHVSLWCLLAAPLLIGCDMTKFDDFTLSLLTNDEVLAIDQDPLGKQATSRG